MLVSYASSMLLVHLRREKEEKKYHAGKSAGVRIMQPKENRWRVDGKVIFIENAGSG